MSSLSDFHNKHSGERIFVVGNGPSLQETPLHLLENEYTTGMNRIDLIYDDTSWRPSYYFQLNPPPRFEQDIESVKHHIDQEIPCFIHSGLRKNFHNKTNTHYVDVEKIDGIFIKNKVNNEGYSNVWSNNICEKVYKKSSTLYAVIQIIAYMGFDEIYFIGTDFYPIFKPAKVLPTRLINRGEHPWEFVKNTESNGVQRYIEYLNFTKTSDHKVSTFINGVWFKIRSDIILKSQYLYRFFGKIDNTHFSPKYRDFRYYDQYKNERLKDIHETIEIISSQEGFKCFNATVGGHLEAHERVDLKKNNKQI